MAANARAKFRVISVEQHGAGLADPGKVGSETIKMAAQYDESLPEDVAFSDATPWGELKMSVTNPNLIGKIRPGEFYYLDFVPVE